MKEFTYKSKYGSYDNCYFMVGRYYENKNLAIEVMSNTEGPITCITVNPSIKFPDDRIAIKNYSENEGTVDTLVAMGLIEPDPVQIIKSGFVEIPVHMLTEAGKEMFKI